MIPIIVTARMTSRRLPGKPLRLIAGVPLVQRVIDNLKHVDGQPDIVLATSIEAEDDPLADWCARSGCACFRGPLEDLATRVIEAANNKAADSFVRVSGDSPLIDPQLVSYALKLYAPGGVDLVSNVQTRTFPKGCSVEVIRVAALSEQLRRHARDHDREHVTTVLYRHPDEIRIVNFTSDTPVGQIQLSVDTIEDCHRIERILEKAGPRPFPLSWRDAVDIYTTLRADPSTPDDDPSMQLSAGIIGLGVGAHHAEAIADIPGCRVAWLCDLDRAKLETYGACYPDAKLSTRAEDVLGDPSVSLVVIASYEDAHAAHTIAALERGKHVLVEKPLCQTEDELKRITAALDRAPGVIFQSNFIMRRFPRLQELRRSIEAGEFGEIYYIEADYNYGRVSKIVEGWRGQLPHYSIMAGGGIHMLDAVLWLTGRRVEEVQGYGNRIATKGTQFRFDDFQVALLRLEGGAVAKISANFACVYPHGHLFAVYGTKKSYIQNALGAAFFSSRDPEVPPVSAPMGSLVAKGAFIPRIVEAIRGRATPEISRQEILDSMRICLAIERAIREQRTIRLDQEGL